MMQQRDYLLRMIEQAVQAILRALHLVEQKDFVQAEASLQSAYGMLGLDRDLLQLLDAASVVSMIGPEKRPTVLQLMLCEVELALARAQHRRASRRFELAVQLWRAMGQESSKDPDQELSARMEALATKLGEASCSR